MGLSCSWQGCLSVATAILVLMLPSKTTAQAGELFSAPLTSDSLRSDLTLNETDFSHLLAGDVQAPPSGLKSPSAGIDFGKVHKYLGYTTIALAGLAAITSSNEDLHYGAAYSATGAALATCVTGLYEYRDRFDLENGILDEDNLHILMGTLGTVAIATAVAVADSGEEKSHAGIGVTGGVSMLVSVIVIKW